MTSKIDLALELKGIAYDAYSSYESYISGGPLRLAEAVVNGTTFLTSLAGLAGLGGVARDVVAFKANEIKFSLSLTELMTEANKPNPNAAIISQALLGLVSSSAGIVGAIPGIPLHIKVGANLIALGADASKEGIGQLPQLLIDLESKIRAAGITDWNVDPMGTGAEAITRASEDAKSVSNAIPEIIITAKRETAASSISTPADSATRNSANFVGSAGANQVEIKAGGTVWDAYVLQKNSGTGFTNWNDYKAAVAASNPNIANLNQIPAGTTLMQPQQMSDGSITYHYSNQVSINQNTTTGEYHMVVPNTDGSGGQTVYSRTADDVGYTVKQVTTNAAGGVVFEHQSYQNTLDADLSPVSASSTSGNQTTTRNWLTDNVFQTDTFVGPPAPNTTPSTSSLNFGPVSYNLFDAAQNNDASYKMWQLNQNNGLSNSAYNSFTQQSSNFVVDYSLGGTGSSNWGQFQAPANFDLFPIGAFYDSQSAAFDNAASIAHKTTRAMNASGQALTTAQLAALDTNSDGSLSTAEASSTRLWADLNENGALDSGELQGVGSAIKSADYAFYTRGNGQAAGARLSAPAAVTVGGVGNDNLYGYAGDDKVYGEEGNDVLLGQGGNDSLGTKMIHRKCNAKQRRLHRTQKTQVFSE